MVQSDKNMLVFDVGSHVVKERQSTAMGGDHGEHGFFGLLMMNAGQW